MPLYSTSFQILFLYTFTAVEPVSVTSNDLWFDVRFQWLGLNSQLKTSNSQKS